MLQVTQTSEDIFGFEKYRLTDKTEKEHIGISNTSLVLNTEYPENTEKGSNTATAVSTILFYTVVLVLTSGTAVQN